MRASMPLLAFVVCACVWSTPARAHDPRLTSVHLHDGPDGAWLDLYVPTEGVRSAFAARFADDAPLDTVAGRERLVRYVRDTVRLTSPGGDWSFGAGGVRVGAHETVVRLTVVPPDGARMPLGIHAPLFAENPGARVTVRYADAASETRVVLRQDAAFAATLDRIDGHVVAHLGHAAPTDIRQRMRDAGPFLGRALRLVAEPRPG